MAPNALSRRVSRALHSSLFPNSGVALYRYGIAEFAKVLLNGRGFCCRDDRIEKEDGDFLTVRWKCVGLQFAPLQSAVHGDRIRAESEELAHASIAALVAIGWLAHSCEIRSLSATRRLFSPPPCDESGRFVIRVGADPRALFSPVRTRSDCALPQSPPLTVQSKLHYSRPLTAALKSNVAHERSRKVHPFEISLPIG
jgi:hypothetical protein